MESQLYIPNQVLSSVSKENAETIKENVILLNKLVAEFHRAKQVDVRKAEHIVYMLLILEKLIYANRDALAELTKIQIIRKDILERLKEEPEVVANVRSNILYPLTQPEVSDVDLGPILEATLCNTTDPLVFREIRDMIIPDDCVIYKMYTNSDFYYYEPNKGFVGTPVAEKAVTEDLIRRTQYIRKIVTGDSGGIPEDEFAEGITMEVIGSPWGKSRGEDRGSSPHEVPVFFILNDKHFAKLHAPLQKDNELYTSRYNLFSILPKDFQFGDLKPIPSRSHGVLSDLFAKQKLEELFTRILLRREKVSRKIAIVNTLTEIFFQKLNRREDLVVESHDKVWNKVFFYEKQHVYMLYLERILGVLENAKGVSGENIIKSLVNMICSDDTSSLASIMAELKK